LLTILMKNPNFLILDEPTNDLDIITLNVLEEYLLDFPGCLIIVTHDRYFMDKLVDHLFILEGGGAIRDYNGTHAEYREMKKAAEKTSAYSISAPEVSDANVEKKGKASFEQRKEFSKLEKEIKKLEEQKAHITERFSDGSLSPEQIMKLSAELQQIQSNLDEKEEKWFALADLMEE